MKTWIIEPRDPFIARDGKPFGAIPGATAKSLQFPFPSTTTGGARTRAALKGGVFNASLIVEVKKIQVRGPLLVRLDEEGKIVEWFTSAPADALLFATKDKGKGCVRQLSPRKPPAGALSNLPYEFLQPVYLTVADPRKPLGKAPRFWRWVEFEKWLLDPNTLANKELQLSMLGHNGPELEWRAHVKIQNQTQTAEEGALFQTRGLAFTHRADDGQFAHRLAFAVSANAEGLNLNSDGIRTGLSHLGGERRIVCWRESKGDDLFASKCPDEIRNYIVDTKRCRVVLLTPAYFKEGMMPTWLCDDKEHGFKLQVKAIANNRCQVVSGWDLEYVGAKKENGKERIIRGRPKPTRRLAPAGSVFWFELLKEDSFKNSIEKWIERVWMNCISDEDQDRKDGFGLAVLGTWNTD